MKTTTFIQFTSLLAAFGSAYEIFVNGNYTHILAGIGIAGACIAFTTTFLMAIKEMEA